MGGASQSTVCGRAVVSRRWAIKWVEDGAAGGSVGVGIDSALSGGRSRRAASGLRCLRARGRVDQLTVEVRCTADVS